jgi:hypothetical protein
MSRLDRQWRREPSKRQREVLPNARIVLFRIPERLDQLRRERGFFLLGELGIGHEARELVGGRPPPIAPAGSDVGQVLPRRPIFAEQAPETDIHQHRGADDEQRNKKELNSDRGRRRQRCASARFSLD